MKLRKPCEHGRYDEHFMGRGPAVPPICPGGVFLLDDALTPLFAEFFASEFSHRSANDPVLLSVARKLVRTLDAFGGKSE